MQHHPKISDQSHTANRKKINTRIIDKIHCRIPFHENPHAGKKTFSCMKTWKNCATHALPYLNRLKKIPILSHIWDKYRFVHPPQNTQTDGITNSWHEPAASRFVIYPVPETDFSGLASNPKINAPSVFGQKRYMRLQYRSNKNGTFCSFSHQAAQKDCTMTETHHDRQKHAWKPWH